MANLTPAAAWPGIQQIETTDDILGGPGGIANLQAQQLLNRQEYMRGGLIGGRGLRDINDADYTITAANAGETIRLVASSVSTRVFSMPNISSWPDMGMLVIQNLTEAGKNIGIDFAAGSATADYCGVSFTEMYVPWCDTVIIYKPFGAIHYHILQCSEFEVGHVKSIMSPIVGSFPSAVQIRGYLNFDASASTGFQPSAFPRLYARIGNTYGTSGGGTFNLPPVTPLYNVSGQTWYHFVKY